MSKMYALFKDENIAKNAISEIEKKNKNIKIDLFSQDTHPIENDVFITDAQIIGSPGAIGANFGTASSANELNANTLPGLSAFVYADFLTTSKNSLNETVTLTSPPPDSYGAGIKITSSAKERDKIKQILTNMGAKIVLK